MRVGFEVELEKGDRYMISVISLTLILSCAVVMSKYGDIILSWFTDL